MAFGFGGIFIDESFCCLHFFSCTSLCLWWWQNEISSDENEMKRCEAGRLTRMPDMVLKYGSTKSRKN